MKKLNTVFLSAAAIIIAAAATGAVFAYRVSWIFSAGAALSGCSVCAYLYARFRAIEYVLSDSCLTARGGVFIKTENVIPFDSVLWQTSVTLGTKQLLTVLHTTSGRLVIFSAPLPARAP